MALLFIDGFDHYATADFLKKWTAVGANAPTIVSTGGRRGGGALNLVGGAASGSKIIPAAATVIVGCAFWRTADGILLTLSEPGLTNFGHVYLSIVSSVFRLYRGDGVLLATGTTAIPFSSWNYVEVKATISDTVGAVSVRVNGVPEFTVSNIDTRMAGTGIISTVVVGSTNSAGNGIEGSVDDLYIANTSGSSNYDFLGDVRIDTLYPNGDGTYSQFTPSTGTAHAVLVDEATPNTTDYNDGLNIGDRDSYQMGNLTALVSQTVYGVQVNAATTKDDAGAKSAATFVRSGGVDSDGASAALGTSQGYVSQLFETNPSGNIAWTETTVNAMEAGVKVTA